MLKLGNSKTDSNDKNAMQTGIDKRGLDLVLCNSYGAKRESTDKGEKQCTPGTSFHLMLVTLCVGIQCPDGYCVVTSLSRSSLFYSLIATLESRGMIICWQLQMGFEPVVLCTKFSSAYKGMFSIIFFRAETTPSHNEKQEDEDAVYENQLHPTYINLQSASPTAQRGLNDYDEPAEYCNVTSNSRRPSYKQEDEEQDEYVTMR